MTCRVRPGCPETAKIRPMLEFLGHSRAQSPVSPPRPLGSLGYGGSVVSFTCFSKYLFVPTFGPLALTAGTTDGTGYGSLHLLVRNSKEIVGRRASLLLPSRYPSSFYAITSLSLSRPDLVVPFYFIFYYLLLKLPS